MNNSKNVQQTIFYVGSSLSSKKIVYFPNMGDMDS